MVEKIESETDSENDANGTAESAILADVAGVDLAYRGGTTTLTVVGRRR